MIRLESENIVGINNEMQQLFTDTVGQELRASNVAARG